MAKIAKFHRLRKLLEIKADNTALFLLNIILMVRFAAKPPDKGNSGADTCRIQALRVLGKKFPLEIFRRKKRAGIAVRVEGRAWDLAAKPTDDA